MRSRISKNNSLLEKNGRNRLFIKTLYGIEKNKYLVYDK